MPCDFYDLQDTGHRDTPALQVIRNWCNNYRVKEPRSLVDTQGTIEDGISFIPNVVELTNLLAETKEKCLGDTKEHDTEVSRLNGLVFYGQVLQ